MAIGDTHVYCIQHMYSVHVQRFPISKMSMHIIASFQCATITDVTVCVRVIFRNNLRNLELDNVWRAALK